ncbi:unnamed protein product [Anisakis simplex]|uniref:Uncharacterized protein n=1 Tax=Anisakis simplex TaxID=6269 RepID=A0A3P6NYE4_ANISI|nr:unnamed protein product [Anisakis simplex]
MPFRERERARWEMVVVVVRLVLHRFRWEIFFFGF